MGIMDELNAVDEKLKTDLEQKRRKWNKQMRSKIHQK